MKKINNKAFTLAELLATIAVLAIILVIAIPQVQKLIYNSRLKSFETTARIIARKAEDEAMDSKITKENKSLACKDLVEMSDDYGTCTVKIEDNEAVVKLKGSNNGKFKGMYCEGTKRDMNCKETDGTIAPANNEDVVEYLEQLLDEETTSETCTGKLIKVTHESGDIDYRYVGECPNNYVTFNDETWRIVGIFDTEKTVGGEKEKRVKLVRDGSLSDYSWDSSDSSKFVVNRGEGVNEWSQADLMNELNGDYLNLSLTSNTKWYSGTNNEKIRIFYKSKVLKASAQSLIDDAVWYTGASESGVSLSAQYSNERGDITGKICTSGGYCSDSVPRTTKWVGKVGLIYGSDYGYASEDDACKNDLVGAANGYPCKNRNWLFNYSYYWTITPFFKSSAATEVGSVDPNGAYNNYYAAYSRGVRPSVYLVSNILISGAGTSANPYTFTLKNN